MIKNNIIILDFESGSRYPLTTQPLQLAAVIIDIKKLEIIKDSSFQSLMRPIFDADKCIELGIDELQDEALNVNHLTREELKDAPSPKLVWNNFVEYTKKYNLKGLKGKQWDSVIVAGYNNTGFDNIIINRLSDQYGPKLDKYGKCTLFHPFHNFDVQQNIAQWFHCASINPKNSISLDAIREYMGIGTENAHDALKDCYDTAFLLIKFLRLIKGIYMGDIDLPKGKRVKFKNCFDKENKLTQKYLETK